MTGPEFRGRLKSIVDSFAIMQEDLNAEKRAMERIWKKRETQIAAVLNYTSQVQGTLEGFGSNAKTISSLELDAIADGSTDPSTPAT